MNFKRSVTTSYENSVLCQVCKFKKKRSELRLRWDGLWVCNDDWELRHPTDFYRNRNDAHVLPYVLSDDGANPALTWSITSSGFNGSFALTSVLADSELDPRSGLLKTITGTYYVDQLQGLTFCSAVFNFTKVDSEGYTYVPREPLSGTTCVTGSLVLPTVNTGAGNALVRTSTGKILETPTIAAGTQFATLAGWSTKAVGHVFFSATYIT